jgi:hypothetical protein
MRHRRRPVFLVLDGQPAHRAKIVGVYVQLLEGRLQLHFLPGYAPDLNPDELFGTTCARTTSPRR